MEMFFQSWWTRSEKDSNHVHSYCNVYSSRNDAEVDQPTHMATITTTTNTTTTTTTITIIIFIIIIIIIIIIQ